MLAQTPPGESLCEFCNRPWFGQVAYCPYCGRQAREAAHPKYREPHLAAAEMQDKELEAELSHASPAVPPPRRRTSFTPTGEEPDGPGRTENPRSSDEAVAGFMAPVGALHEHETGLSRQLGGTSPGAVPPLEPDKPPSSPRGKNAARLLFKIVVAGASASLLFWMGLRLLGSETNEEASPTPVAAPAPAPAAPAPAVQPRAAPAAPPSLKKSLCSEANEKAGLCKTQ